MYQRNKKTFELLFYIDGVILGKDVFLVPYTISKLYGYQGIIIYHHKENKLLPNSIRGVKLNPISNNYRYFRFLIHIIKYARKIDFLMVFHIRPYSFILIKLYKFLNPGGFVYVKSDLTLEVDYAYIKKRRLKMFLLKMFLNPVDLLTVETRLSYNRIKKLCGERRKKKIVHMPNFFDEDELKKQGLKLNNIKQKENIIITVSRLGTKQKNTEMILKAAEILNFKDWKLILIGTIEDNFKDTIDQFFNDNPTLNDKVVFTGGIYDKRTLWDYYNKCKVFLLPSRFEGFANVLLEAIKFRNYIIGTDVGGVSDVLNMSGYGEIIPQEDEAYLARILQKIVDDEEFLNNEYVKVSWDSIDVSGDTIVKNSTENFFK